jgi:UDP-glucuronate 4-epimerase
LKDIILVTGAAGFIGSHLIHKLLSSELYEVVGVDNINDYYDPNLKQARLDRITDHPDFTFYKIDLQDAKGLEDIFTNHKPAYVVNLAAQAGVRYSIENPHAYTETNITGFLNILECSKKHKIKHLLYASSSSVYGLNQQDVFHESMSTEHPMSMYAATKKANEMMAHSYSSLFDMPVTGLRFFTAYGPWGRPDMALFMFTKDILEGNPINVFNNGDMQRDFTYVDDIAEGVFRLTKVIPKRTPQSSDLSSDSSFAPYEIYNIGNGSPSQLMDYVKAIEETLDIKAKINFMPLQPGDVPKTSANTDKLFEATGFRPYTPIEQGVENFVNWYRAFYNV